mmetsp:Transcript_9093/g.22888  ORF Transcript_9093/g.22888 Transcript_9093/m.22888 type:complete len:298 (-) Transcript_9093:357-1250(-)|eukprot:jgi/Tetstr1/426915/TSEL_017128.t1
MIRSRVGVALGVAVLLGAALGGSAQVSVCQRSVFVWEALPETATALQKINLNQEMESFCEQFEPGQEFAGRGLMCRTLFQASSAFPAVTAWVTGCCNGTVSTNIQAKFPVIRSCRDIQPGNPAPSLDVKIIAGETDGLTDVNGTALDRTANGTWYKGFEATAADAFKDWRIYLSFFLILLFMLICCSGCLVWICKKHKKEQRDAKYQEERTARLVATSRPQLSMGYKDPLIQTPEPSEAPVERKGAPEMDTPDTPLVNSKLKKELEFSSSDDDNEADNMYGKRNTDLTEADDSQNKV